MMGRLATLMGCTEGQAYTILIALTLSLSMAALGLPPTLEARGDMAPMAAPEEGAPGEQTLTPQDPTEEVPTDDAETGGAPADLPDATRVDGPTGAGEALDAPAGPGAGPTAAADDDGPALQGADPVDGGFELQQEERLGQRFGAAQLFVRVEDPGVPHGVAVGEDAVYVSTDNASGRGESDASVVRRYGHEGEQTGELELEGQDGARLRGAPDVVVDGDGAVLTVDPAAGRVVRLDIDAGEQHTHLELPDLAPCALPTSSDPCEPGAVDRTPQPVGLAVAADGALFVSDPAQATIWRVDGDGNLDAWHQDPAYRLGLPGGGGLAGLTVDGDGHLLAVIASALADEVPASGAVHRIEVEPDGSSGARRQLLRTDPAAGPADVAAGASGRVYVTLAGADELVVLDGDGDEQARIDAGSVARDTGTPLDGPAGLAFHDDALLVANSAVLGDEEHWAVLRIAVEDAVADPG